MVVRKRDEEKGGRGTRTTSPVLIQQSNFVGQRWRSWRRRRRMMVAVAVAVAVAVTDGGGGDGRQIRRTDDDDDKDG